MEKIKSEKGLTKNPIFGVQTVEVIKVMVSSGAGTLEDPSRLVTQYWDKNGKLIGKEDPCIKIQEMSKVQKSITCQSAECQIQKEQTVFDLLTAVTDSGKFAAIIYDLLRKYESPEEIELFLNQKRDNLDEAIDYLKSRNYPIEHKKVVRAKILFEADEYRKSIQEIRADMQSLNECIQEVNSNMEQLAKNMKEVSRLSREAGVSCSLEIDKDLGRMLYEESQKER